MVLKRVGVVSMGKILGILYALFGLIFGALASLVSIFAAALSSAMGGMEGSPLGFLFGAGAVIAMPIFYGVLGFIGGLIGALLYNLVARVAGGLELQLEEARPVQSAAE